MFEKSLSDLIRGLRANKSSEAKYIAQCFTEIKNELKTDKIETKANAVSKLCYLQMLGFNVGWAAFNIIEVMSCSRFSLKRIGYLAAAHTFNEQTDVLMLTTNMIKKDLASQNVYEAGMAMNGLSNFITSDLARDLANDIVNMVNSSRPYVRKKAILVLYKVFLKFPEALRPAFPRLKEKLEDLDPSVQSAAVNVICELARKNPKNYLPLAPLFFKLLTESSNNWMLIKIVKLLGALTPLEPRLGKKLVEPLTNIINATPAMSLLYECINTVINGMTAHENIVQLCVSKLRVFVEDTDQNLKYLGLLALSKVLKTHPKPVAQHKELIIKCLDDDDESIKLRALDLLVGLATRKTLMDVVKRLMTHMASVESVSYRDEVIFKIITMCSQDSYHFVNNFEWYLSTLVELTRAQGTRHGKLIASQILDVTIRVKVVRPYSVKQMSELLTSQSSHLFNASFETNGVCEVLGTAAWIVGEYAELLRLPLDVMTALLSPRVITLPGNILSIFIQNAIKIFAAVAGKAVGYVKPVAKGDDEDEQPEDEDEEDVDPKNPPVDAAKATSLAPLLKDTLEKRLPMLTQHGDLEVQERSCMALSLVKVASAQIFAQAQAKKSSTSLIGLDQGAGLANDDTVDEVEDEAETEVCLSKPATEGFCRLFEGELNPVAAKAQKKVPVPEGLDLNAWINEPPADSSSSESGSDNDDDDDGEERVGSKRSSKHSKSSKSKGKSKSKSRSKDVADDPEELERRRTARKQAEAMNDFYLKDRKKKPSSALLSSSSVDDIPVATLDLGGVKLTVDGQSSSSGKSKKGGKKSSSSDNKKAERGALPKKKYAVRKVSDAPEGANSDDEDKDARDDTSRALDVDLTAPLESHEILPVRSHRMAQSAPLDEKKSKKLSGSAKNTKGKDDDAEKKKKKKKKTSAGKDGEEGGDEKKKKKKKGAEADKEDKHASKKKSSKATKSTDLIELKLSELKLSESDETPPAKSKAKQAQQTDAQSAGSPSALLQSSSKSLDEFSFWLSDTPTSPTAGSASTVAASSVGSASSSKSSPATPSTPVEEKKKKKMPVVAAILDDSPNPIPEKKKSSKKESSKLVQADDLPSGLEKERKKSKKASASASASHAMSVDDIFSGYGQTTFSNLKSLAKNECLELFYQTTVDLSENRAIQVLVTLKNISELNLSNVELTVVDSLNAKLENSQGMQAIKIPVDLPPGSNYVAPNLVFHVEDITVNQRLRGSLSYVAINEANETSSDKLDFQFFFSPSLFVVAATCKKSLFTDILSGGELASGLNAKIPALKEGLDAKSALESIARDLHLSIVEAIDAGASLYGLTIKQQHVCVLVKYIGENGISVDIKTSDSKLSENFLSEIKQLVSPDENVNQ